MSSPDNLAIAQEIADVASVRTQTICTVVLTTLLLYDVTLTSGQESQYVWGPSKSWVSRVLYVWNRYMALLYCILQLGTIPSISDKVDIYVYVSVQYLGMLGPAVFTSLRIYALSRKNRVLGGLALVLSVAPFAINLTHYRWIRPINLPAPVNCTAIDVISPRLQTRLVIASRSCLILADSLAVAVTWYQARSANAFRSSTMCRPSLEQIMWDNGTTYFCALVSLNAVDMILVILSITIQPGSSAYVFIFIDPISSILNSRFLLALHETNTRLGGTNTSISTLAFELNGDGEPRDGSPELPEFLATVGGPIHSFPSHEDDVLGSLEFVLPSHGGDSEVAAEVEAGTEGGVESGTAF